MNKKDKNWKILSLIPIIAVLVILTLVPLVNIFYNSFFDIRWDDGKYNWTVIVYKAKIAKLITNFTSAGTGQYISVANDASITLASSGGTQSALVLAYEGSNGKGGVWFVTYAGTAVLLAGTDCSATDEDNKICVFKSATSHTTTFKNRLGTTLNFQIAQIGGFLG